MNCTACQSPRGHRHSPSIVSCVIKACCQASQSDHAAEIPWRYKNILPERKRLFVFVVCLFVCLQSSFFVVVGERNKLRFSQDSKPDQQLQLYLVMLSCPVLLTQQVIGGSLSEPHMHCALVCTYACLDQPLTINFK